jgi:transcriptional regulator with XRE-family HTH domain
MIKPAQIRMARAALGISVRELATKASVAESTILRFETSKGGMQAVTLNKIQIVLEAAGLLFLPEGPDGGIGVRFGPGKAPLAPERCSTGPASPTH